VTPVVTVLKTSEPNLLAPGKQLEKFTENAFAQRERVGRMTVRVAQDVLEAMLRAGSFGLGAIFRNVQPALDESLVGFQVKLQSVCAVAESKRLVRAGGSARQVNGAVGQVERVGMPLEYVLVAVEVATERVPAGRGCGMQAIPADLTHIVGPHGGAQRRGKKLRAEADPQNRYTSRQGFLDGGDLDGQVREALGFIDVHGPAEHDEAVVSAHVRPLIRLARKVDVTNAESGPSEHGIEDAEGFAGRMLEDQELAHAATK